MAEIDGSSKPPQQISEMFQKFALAFRTKTVEFFAEEDEDGPEDSDGLSLLDSAEEIITDQKVVVIKPDNFPASPATPTRTPPAAKKKTRKKAVEFRLLNPELVQTLASSIFATVSKFEASYLQLQTSHVPLNEESVKSADRALVSHLQRLSEFKRLYESGLGSSMGSCLEAQVEENQSKLRTLGTVADKLQEEIDRRDEEVSALRVRLEEIQSSNAKLSKRLNGNNSNQSSCCEVLASVRVFDSALNEACRLTHRFTKILIELMRGVGWDLDLAANLVHPNVDYAKRSHNQYAFLSYVCLGMFKNFDTTGFETTERDGDSSEMRCSSPGKLLEHVACSPMELLSRDRNCDFSRFCERKYQEIIHPTMESSIFSDVDQKEAVLSSWRSLSVFYEAYVNMASSIWTLHKLASLFDPIVEIFQVERGADFSMVFMKDVTKRWALPPSKSRPKVGFTVFPGFKIGKTVIQSQVYLTGLQ